MALYTEAKGRKGFIRSLSFHTHGFDASEDSIELEWEELGELLVAGQIFKIVLFPSGTEWRDREKYCIFLTSSNCQARVRSPKVQSPKVKTKRTWADTIITWATTPPIHPPLTFKHEGVLW